LFYPELAGVRQPLASEVAARRELLERLPFVTGYGVEIAMLIDAGLTVGLGKLAQVDLDEHRNRHQPLSVLEPMALTVLATITRRLQQEGRLQQTGDGAPLERLPLNSLVIARAVDLRDCAVAGGHAYEVFSFGVPSSVGKVRIYALFA
jgi:hypothetical protein